MKERGRDQFNRYKKLIIFLTKVINILPLGFRLKLFNLFQNTNGKVGIAIRYVFLRSIARKCGDNVSIHKGVYLLSPQKLSLGSNISIHPMCYLDATGSIIIESDVSIAHGSTILSTTHSYGDETIPIKDQPLSYSETKICENVWIGCKSTILYGTTVKSGSIVGANSLINKGVEKNTIVAGVPAKTIKYRN